MSEEGVTLFREDESEAVPNKTKALYQLNKFFQWLKDAESEEGEDEDEDE